MALLVDKHRPRSLDALTYHKDLSERLRSLVCPTNYQSKWLHTHNAHRLKAAISLICLFMDHLAQGKRLAL